MIEQSQMPLVGPLKRRGWREIVWFRPLTSSTHAALVVTRRGRLTSILPASGPRTLSDYLAWPYDFREVDTRERLLTLDQRLESLDSAYEFSVAVRLAYQVVRAERVALELEDVQAELAHAVVQSLRLSGRSFGIEQDKTFEEHLQETLLYGDALVQRIQALGLVLRRADVTVMLDEATRAHADALRYTMRERPLHFQVAIESLEPNRRFDVHVGGAYRLTERRAQDGPSESTESAIQMAITRTLRRVGITFAPSDYANAAKAMAETLRRDTLLQSELSMVQAQLLRPTVQIQPDHSMVHVPRPNSLGVPDTRPDPALRRLRQGPPRVSRPRALLELNEGETPRQASLSAVRRALPPPDQRAAGELPSPNLSPDQRAAGESLSPTSPLGELPASHDAIEGAYTLWPLPESMPALRELPAPGQPDDEHDERAPWADLIDRVERAPQDVLWSDPLPASLSAPVEPLPWDAAVAGADESEPQWSVTPPASLSAPVEPLPWDSTAAGAEELAPKERVPEEPAPQWPATPAFLSAPVEPLPWDSAAPQEADQPLPDAPSLIWPALDSAFGAETSTSAPNLSSDGPSGDLGFTLDWSEPERAHTVDTLRDDLGFTLDWSEPQVEPAANDSSPSVDTPANHPVFTAHWDDPVIIQPESALFSDTIVDEHSADAMTPDLHSSPAVDPDRAHQHSDGVGTAGLPVQANQDEEQSALGLDASPWYTPTMHVDDQLPFDTAMDDAQPPIETFDVAWAEPSIEPSAPIDEPSIGDASVEPPAEVPDALWAEPSFGPSRPTDQQEIEHFSPATAEDPEPAAAISAELIAQMIGMVQSYGPAWFKMWSLELKERPERLPVVLGEVTADQVLLAQANDPHVQSALLLALAAYTAPAGTAGRLTSPAPLASPAMAVPSNEDEDAVPDWLSLRVKWNGHGGGR